MNSADVHTLTGAYAADALDDVERAEFEEHLTACADCREEVRGFRATVARLAGAAAVAPPAAIRARVLASIATTAQLPPLSRPPGSAATSAPGGESTSTAPVRGVGEEDRAGSPAGNRQSRRRPFSLAVAASVAIMLALTVGSYGYLQTQRAAQAERALARIVAVTGDPSARRLSVPVSGGGSATLVISPSAAVFLAKGLPALTDRRAYQLWIIHPNSRIDSAGMGEGSGRAATAWSRSVDGVHTGDKVAVSVEPSGGSTQPTTTPIVVIPA